MVFRVIEPVSIEGVRKEPGVVVELDDETALRLLGLGCVEEVLAEKPAPAAAPKTEASAEAPGAQAPEPTPAPKHRAKR